MPRTAHIIGTDHVFQFGAGVKFGDRTCTAEQGRKFREFLLSVSREREICAIAEELSPAALEELNRTESVPCTVAASLSLAHCYCDPNRIERIALEIAEDTAVEASGQLQRKSPEQIEALIQQEWRKREAHWLTKLNELNSWPVLFVCGASHVNSFVELLSSNGIDTGLVVECWDA